MKLSFSKSRLSLASLGLVAPLLFGGIILSGCQEQPKVVQTNYPQVRFMDPSLREKLLIQDLATRKNDGGLMEFELRATSTSGSDTALVYKTDWSAQGFTIKTIMSRWVSVDLEAGRDLIIRGVAPKPEADSFLIRLGYPSSNDRNRLNSFQYENQGE